MGINQRGELAHNLQRNYKEHRSTDYLGFVSDNTFISLSTSNDADITDSIFIDELGFFETGFSIYEIEGLYEDGLSGFLEAIPVNPEKKLLPHGVKSKPVDTNPIKLGVHAPNTARLSI